MLFNKLKQVNNSLCRLLLSNIWCKTFDQQNSAHCILKD